MTSNVQPEIQAEDPQVQCVLSGECATAIRGGAAMRAGDGGIAALRRNEGGTSTRLLQVLQRRYPMPNVARAHHFVPESLLAGFTPSGKKEDKLWVIDLTRKKEWTTIPKNVAHRRDFYRIEVPGVAPDFLEQRLLAPLDGEAISIIRRIEETGHLPSDSERMHILLLYVALLATRVPLARLMVDGIVNRVAKDRFAEDLADGDSWERVLIEMKQMGLDTSGMEFISMKALLPSIQFKANQAFQLRIMLEGAFDLVPTLVERVWSTAVSPSGRFITSDRPVSVSFTTPPPWSSFPAFAVPGTRITVPLSRTLALRGEWGGLSRSGEINRKGVAHFNSVTLNSAERFIFSAYAEFPWVDQSRRVCYGASELSRKGEPVFKERRPGDQTPVDWSDLL